MADNIKVKDLPDTSSIQMTNELMVLVDSTNNEVNNISISDFNSNIISSDADNVLVKGSDNKLYIETPETITGDLDNLTTSDKTNLVAAVNELDYNIDTINNTTIGNLSDLRTTEKSSIVNSINELADIVEPSLITINNSKALETGSIDDNSTIYADILKYAHSTFDSGKFTITSTPTITDNGILLFANSLSAYPSADFDFAGFFSQSAGITIFRGQFIGAGSSSGQADIVAIPNLFEIRRVENSSFHILVNGSYLAYNVIPYVDGHKYNWEIELILPSTINITITDIDATNATYSGTGTFTVPATVPAKINYFAEINHDLKYCEIVHDGILVFNGNKTGIDTIKANNYNIVGTPTINNGVISSVGASNYVTIPDLNISSATDFVYITPWFKLGDVASGINIAQNWAYTYTDTRINYFKRASDLTHIEYAIIHGNTTPVISKTFASPVNTWVQMKFEYKNETWKVYYRTLTSDWILDTTASDSTPVTISGVRPIGWENASLFLQNGEIDLNGMQVYVNGNLIYQPCLYIPYTESKTGSKVVDVAYRPRVADMYEQFGIAPYYTIDEANANFTLPMGEIYGGKLDRTIPHIVENYRNGASWYRVWSDGLIEQGGDLTLDTSSYTFLKAYTSYARVFVQTFTNNTAAATNLGAWLLTSMPTTTGFSCPITSTYYEGGYWFARGY